MLIRGNHESIWLLQHFLTFLRTVYSNSIKRGKKILFIVVDEYFCYFSMNLVTDRVPEIGFSGTQNQINQFHEILF